MTGRARARARGRARGQEPAQPGQARAPQAPITPATQPQKSLSEPSLVGRGRQRGPSTVERPPADVLQISAGFQEISLGERGGRRRDFHDFGVNTRQTIEHVKVSKTGASGNSIQLVTNHIKLVSRPQWVLYQYHIDYNPPMDSRRLRTALLYQHEETIGKLMRVFFGLAKVVNQLIQSGN
ncbi:piwi-like protein 1 [Mixophyes fleayi]|uniref:piwi-like protein 1 n=1 Tax=Mixophyes fleayi TaxID=3061075 RepID=UPI003F4DEBCF